MQTLDVVFRAERSGDHKGEVTAVFPTEYEHNGLHSCYAHIGQHGACSRAWYAKTRPATESEYADLLAELRGIYETPPAAWGIAPLKLIVRRRAKWG